jgi:hypothetical protein
MRMEMVFATRLGTTTSGRPSPFTSATMRLSGAIRESPRAAPLIAPAALGPLAAAAAMVAVTAPSMSVRLMSSPP